MPSWSFITFHAVCTPVTCCCPGSQSIALRPKSNFLQILFEVSKDFILSEGADGAGTYQQVGALIWIDSRQSKLAADQLRTKRVRTNARARTEVQIRRRCIEYADLEMSKWYLIIIIIIFILSITTLSLFSLIHVRIEGYIARQHKHAMCSTNEVPTQAAFRSPHLIPILTFMMRGANLLTIQIHLKTITYRSHDNRRGLFLCRVGFSL